MTRNNRDDAPLDTFLSYYAFKAEERKFYLRYPNQHPNKGFKEPYDKPMETWKAFQSFVCESQLRKKEYYISKKQYLEIPFMNEVPEMVCDVLFYLSGYIH